jgi:hypothetical protein
VNVRRDASLEYISRRRLIRDVVGLMALASASCHRYPKVDTSAAHRRVGGMDGDLFMYADRLWLEKER